MEDLPVEQLVPELLTSLTPSALTTSATFLPWPSRTSASRSLAMISSARKPLRGIDLPPNALQALTSAWTDSRGEGHRCPTPRSSPADDRGYSDKSLSLPIWQFTI